MNLPPNAEATVRQALDAVAVAAGAAQRAPDLAAALEALNRVWFAVHGAQQALRAAETETRARALAANDATHRATLQALMGEAR